MDRMPSGAGSQTVDVAPPTAQPFPTDTQIRRWAVMLAAGELTTAQFICRVSQLQALAPRTDWKPQG